MDNTDFIEIPVTINYNPDKVIGTLRINKTQLPPRLNWTLAPGAIVKNMNVELDEEVGKKVAIFKDYELTTVSLIFDHMYKRFTKSGGEILE